ncbi:hypothetical protein Nmel_015909 [Mimus melanotis]
MSIGSWTLQLKPFQQLSVTPVSWCSWIPALLLPLEDLDNKQTCSTAAEVCVICLMPM